jgi:hypothetical protein
MKSFKQGMLALTAGTLMSLPAVQGQILDPQEFNEPGNILIADQFNNRVIEITESGKIVWNFGRGPLDFSPKSIIGVNDSQRIGPFTLMAGTGTPPGVIPQAPGGVADNRVMIVDPSGKIVWQYGVFGSTDFLNTPVQATYLPNTDVLITDQANNRIIEVNLKKQIVWSYPGVNMNTNDQLVGPNSAELLENGHVLIADQGNNRAIEVGRGGPHNDDILRTFTAGNSVAIVAFASRLPNGHTLLTDSGNARIVEVDANDNVVWQYFTDLSPESVGAPLPTRAVRLRNGDTLISDQFNNRVIRVDRFGFIVARYGLPLDGGTGAIGLNVGYSLKTSQKGLYSPYDAKVVGDYTGLTPPFDFDHDADDN